MIERELAILGCGNIGTSVIKALQQGSCPGYRLRWVFDQRETDGVRIAVGEMGATWLKDPGELGPQDRPDVLFEAATPSALRQFAERFLEQGTTVVAMSVGALVDQEFLSRCLETARRAGVKFVVPSGAIGGLDVLRAARALGGLHEVKVTTTKAPQALAGAPFFTEHPVDLDALDKKTLIFSGTAREAIPLFPANVNILCSISLAGLGPDRTRARIFADPAARRTVHVVEAKGDFGKFRAEFQNFPSPDNPRSSYLASLSAVAALQRLGEDLVLS
ncbi:MAG: aspartate dehydrogenase [Anaerolineae bacterium]